MYEVHDELTKNREVTSIHNILYWLVIINIIHLSYI